MMMALTYRRGEQELGLEDAATHLDQGAGRDAAWRSQHGTNSEKIGWYPSRRAPFPQDNPGRHFARRKRHPGRTSARARHGDVGTLCKLVGSQLSGALGMAGFDEEAGTIAVVAYQEAFPGLQESEEMDHRSARLDAVGGLEDEAARAHGGGF